MMRTNPHKADMHSYYQKIKNVSILKILQLGEFSPYIVITFFKYAKFNTTTN